MAFTQNVKNAMCNVCITSSTSNNVTQFCMCMGDARDHFITLMKVAVYRCCDVRDHFVSLMKVSI